MTHAAEEAAKPKGRDRHQTSAEMLQGLGFSRSQVTRALATADGDEQAALAALQQSNKKFSVRSTGALQQHQFWGPCSVPSSLHCRVYCHRHSTVNGASAPPQLPWHGMARRIVSYRPLIAAAGTSCMVGDDVRGAPSESRRGAVAPNSTV